MTRNELILLVFVTAWGGTLGCVEEAYDPLDAGVQDSSALPGTGNWILTPSTPGDWAGSKTQEPSPSPIRY